MGFRGAFFALLSTALFGHAAVFASSGGITGQSTAGCTLGGCHGDAPGSYNYTGTVERFNGSAWTGTTTTVARNAAVSIRYYLDYVSGSVAVRGGFDMTANGGTLTESDATIQNIGGELTHTTPRTMTGNDINFNNITWTAPNSSGTFTIFTCGQPVNFADGNANDGPHRCDSLAITVNDPPVIGNVANQTINEDGTTGALPFTVSDSETATTSLSVTRSSSNTTVVPLANVVLGGSAGNRTVTVTPAAGQSGSSTITITVTDGNSQTDSDTFLVTVNAVNDAPTITPIADPAAIDEDAGQQTVNFSGIGDGSTLESDTISVTASSSNTALIPNPTVTYTSANTTGSLAYTPVANASGSATITVTVTDSGGTANGGDNTTTDTFTVTVNSVNDEPTLNAIANPAAINEDAAQQTVNLSGIAAGGSGTESSQTLVVTASSSNAALIPNPTVTYTSPNATGSIAYTPVANANGSATITVTVTDNGGTANGGDNAISRQFTVTVNAQNDAPVAVDDADSAAKNSSGNVLTPLVNDTDLDAGDTKTIVSVGATSNGGSVSIVGAGANNTLSYSPATNYSGTETFTYTMQDGSGAQDTATFTVTVGTGVAPVAVDDATAVLEDSTGNAIDPLANDTDDDIGDTMEITAVGPASNGGSVSIVGSGPGNTLSYAPAANFFGTETFTYTVRDAGLLTDTGTVTVTVTNVNDVPTLSAIASPAAVDEDATLQTVNLTGIGAGSGETQTLTVTAGSSNTALIPNPSVTYTSPNATGSLSYTPVANASGSAVITVTVMDNGGTANGGVDIVQRTFTVTVNGVNDQPTLSAIGNPAAIGEDAGEQIVNLAGIAAGGSGTESSQTLTTTASSSNPSLIPHPTVTYTSPNATGSVAYTPVADANGTAVVTVTVTDSGGTANGGVNAISRTFTVSVNAANDTPVIAAIPDQVATDNALFSYTVSVTDADGETSFTYGLTGAPAGMSIDGSGTITWTPPIGTAGVFTPTVEATDGDPATGTRTFQITVTAPDSDGDGMPDSFETLHGLDPDDPSDADADADGDGVSNLDEYLAGLDPTTDDVAPLLTTPADLVVPSTGYLTVVDLGTPTAVDGLDGELTATSDLVSTALRPGRYVVTWTASDAAGNVATDTQQVDVLPLVELSGFPAGVEGGAGIVIAMLNGEAPEYPVEIPYTLGGTAGPGDTDAVAGTFTIASGSDAFVIFNIGDDGVPEGDETLVFTLTGATHATLGMRSSYTVTIAAGNVAPLVTLSGAQGALARLTAYQLDGLFDLSTFAFDANGGSLTYDWSASDDALGIDGVTDGAPAFDPAGLAPGPYTARVTVSDGAGASASASMLVVVAAGSSGIEDVDSDGVPDDVDTVTDYVAVLQDQAGDPATSELIETESALQLRRGRTSLAAGRTGALIAMSDIVTVGIGAGGLPLGADSYENVGGLFDFEIHGLLPGGWTARVVLPLQTAIREGSVYRKFDPVDGWHDFVEDANNAVASAFSTLGQCPGPASDEYVAGLQPFADCVRLTLQDGGPNDADGVADGVIRDPGGVAFVGASRDDDTQSVSSGAFLALWLPLAALLRLRRRPGAALLALCAVLAAAPAQAEHHVRIHYSGDVASGFDSNVTNAQMDDDIRESGFASATGNVDYLRNLSLYTTLLLRGSAQGEYWNSFDGLNNGKGTAMARLLYRADGDFYTPTFAGWVSAAVMEFDSAIRDSNEYRTGVFVTENLTTQVTGRFALGMSRRESDGLVYDLSGYSASANLDWAAAPRTVVYTGYQYYVGDVASTASSTSFWIVDAAEAIEADDAFGGLDGGLLAYRLDAKAHIATLGFNYAFSRKLSADVQGQYISTRATERIDYERMVGVVSLLARF